MNPKLAKLLFSLFEHSTVSFRDCFRRHYLCEPSNDRRQCGGTRRTADQMQIKKSTLNAINQSKVKRHEFEEVGRTFRDVRGRRWQQIRATKMRSNDNLNATSRIAFFVITASRPSVPYTCTTRRNKCTNYRHIKFNRFK